MIRRIFRDIREKTENMSKRETAAYVLTYYWYHILAVCSIIALIVLFITHYTIGNQKPVFTCVLVNQEMDSGRDGLVRETFSEYAGLPVRRVVIDSDYNFSYEGMKLSGVNESSYEKFFFQWRNRELDALILSESFYQYCREMGGSFCDLSDMDKGDFEIYKDGDMVGAIILGEDSFAERVTGKKGEKLLLAFPDEGKHEESREMFLKYLCDVKAGKVEGVQLSDLIR